MKEGYVIRDQTRPRGYVPRSIARICNPTARICSKVDSADLQSVSVEEGIVFRAEDYKYSSASDYSGEKGMLDGVCVFQYFKL